MGDSEKIDLPVGWIITDVDAVSADIASGSGFPKEYQGDSTGDYPFAKVGTISKAFRAGHKTMDSADNYISEEVRHKIKAKPFPMGTIVFPKIGEALKGNYRVITSREMIFDNNVMGIVPETRCIVCDYFYYFLTTKDFGEFAVATAVPSVRRGDVASISIPLPPLPEQQRIVAKIEELFSELDKGIESFKTAREQLKVYRQALLKHAFEGKLTAAWRENNKDKLETADVLLKRIQTERAERYKQQVNEWEQTVKEWEKSGKQGSKPGKPSTPKELPPLTTEELVELPELPDRWGWVKLGHIQSDDKYAVKAGPFGSALKKESYVANGYKIYGQEQVISGDPEFGDYFVDDNKYQELISCTVKPDDILISLVGTIGKVLVLPESAKPGIINPRLVKVSLNLKQYRPSFFKAYFESSFLKSLYANESQGTTMDILNLGIIQNLPYPFCSVDEQEQILQVIETRFSEIDNLDQTITAALQQAETLRQSILKKAFSGQLVPQDPNDEPATELLARIKAERAVHSKTDSTSTTRTPRKKKVTS